MPQRPQRGPKKENVSGVQWAYAELPLFVRNI